MSDVLSSKFEPSLSLTLITTITTKLPKPLKTFRLTLWLQNFLFNTLQGIGDNLLQAFTWHRVFFIDYCLAWTFFFSTHVSCAENLSFVNIRVCNVHMCDCVCVYVCVCVCVYVHRCFSCVYFVAGRFLSTHLAPAMDFECPNQSSNLPISSLFHCRAFAEFSGHRRRTVPF